MARRNAFRRKILDDGQQEEAMKVLKKYVQNKYRGSVLISQQDLLDVSAPQFEPLQRPQSLLIGSRNFERQSTTFSFAPQVYDGAPPLSPKLVSLDFEESKVLEDIKYDSRKDTILTYPIRVIKSLMHNQVAKQLFCLLLIAIIGLIGGAVFQSLEQPNQEYEIIREKEITMERHRNFSQEILKQLASNDCFLKMNRSKEVQITQENSYCQQSFIPISGYDNAFRVDHGITKQWEWDYWNSVFFAGTVFTTIGYGILAPKTVGGRIAFIVYALVSIPLLLVAMNVFGAPILKAFREKYGIVKRKIAQATRGIRRPFRRVFLNRSTTYSGILDVDLATISVAEEENEVNEVDEYENIPWQIAVIILIGFLVLCAWMFTLWEDWTFFESFYFTFTSLTTVGFGDVVPEHPRFALILFIFYTGGVFVVSTVYAYMQSKIEEKYFWALQLVDQTGQEFDLTRDDGSPVKFDGDGGVRWRSPSGAIGGMSMETGLNSEDMVLFATTPGEAPTAAPPSISTLIRQMSTKRNSMARSESKSSFCSKRRPFSNSPSASEQLTPVENKKMWPGPDFTGQASFQIGPKPSTSAPSLAPPRNLTGGGGLSVITEVSDEDTLHSRRNTRRHLSELFPKQPSSKEHNDTEEESFEMIDDKLDDAVMEDVVETATEDDTDTEKESVIPDIAITPSSSGRTRQLRRVPAQDVETPAVEHVPISLQDLSLSDEESDEQITGL